MKKTIVILISCLFIAMWVYTAADKWANFEAFQVQMHKQPLPAFAAPLLIWFLPPLELILAALLFFDKTRRLGLWLSFGLMAIFSGYVALLIGKYLGQVPCACAGLFRKMTWENHLILNIVFTVLAAIALWLTRGVSDHSSPGARGINSRLATGH